VTHESNPVVGSEHGSKREPLVPTSILVLVISVSVLKSLALGWLFLVVLKAPPDPGRRAGRAVGPCPMTTAGSGFSTLVPPPSCPDVRLSFRPKDQRQSAR
jgi:hypothetical protein